MMKAAFPNTFKLSRFPARSLSHQGYYVQRNLGAPNPRLQPFESLAGKTVFISGGSRGIGLSIGRKCAQEGANVVIAAKTVEPHPKLEGTIFTAAQECKALGAWGRMLMLFK